MVELNLQLHESNVEVFDVSSGPKQRLRVVNGITNNFEVARNDLKLCVRIINRFDSRAGLWQSTDGEQLALEKTYGVSSCNPVLQNIVHFLIDEEGEELLSERVPFEPEVNKEKHTKLFKVINILSFIFKIFNSKFN